MDLASDNEDHYAGDPTWGGQMISDDLDTSTLVSNIEASLLSDDYEEAPNEFVNHFYGTQDFLMNPTCSPEGEETDQNPKEVMCQVLKDTFAKLAALKDTQDGSIVLGSGFVLSESDAIPFNNPLSDHDSDIDGNDSPDSNDCPLCTKKFKYRYQVVAHLEKIHNRCPKCEYKYETAEDLQVHIRMNGCGSREIDNFELSEDEIDVNTHHETKFDKFELAVDVSSHIQHVNDNNNNDNGAPEKEKICIDKKRLHPTATAAFDFDDGPEAKDSKEGIMEAIKKLQQQQAQQNAPPVSAADGIPDEIMAPNYQVKEEMLSDDESVFDYVAKDPVKERAPPPPSPPPPAAAVAEPEPAAEETPVKHRTTRPEATGRNSNKGIGRGPPGSRPIPRRPVEGANRAPPQPRKRVISRSQATKQSPVRGEVIDYQTLAQYDGELTCDICELTVEGLLEMESHANTHIPPAEVSCVVCNMTFKCIEDLQPHEEAEHAETAYKCGTCSRVFNSQAGFKDHERFHNDFITCPICDKKFLDDEKLKKHQELRCDGLDFRCSTCKMTFSSLEELKVHKEQHARKIFRCDKCGKEYYQKQSLAVHRMSHTGDDKPFKCKVCGKGFKTYWYYVVHEKCYCKHIDNEETGEKGAKGKGALESKKKFYQCKICGRVFPHISHLKVHNYIHTGERPYKCSSCGKGFTQKQNLKVHERVHTGEKPYICNSCGFGFKDLGNLRRHQYIHTGEKPHGCDICNKRFTWVESLRRHKRTHFKQRPYMCSICKREFVHHGHLRIHELVHKDEKPFQCNICGKAFTMLSSLSIHEHIHLEKKPYPCDLCQRTFMTASALTTHKQSHAVRLANAYRQAYRDAFSF